MGHFFLSGVVGVHFLCRLLPVQFFTLFFFVWFGWHSPHVANALPEHRHETLDISIKNKKADLPHLPKHL